MAGDERIFAFVRLPPPWQDLRLVVGLPAVWALAGVNEELRRNLTWLGLVALFAMLAAWYGAGTFLIQPLKRLTGVTAQLAGGNLQVRAGPAYPGGELGSLARAFDGMADALEARDAELKQAAEELRQRLRELNRRTLELEAANKEMEDFTYTVSHDLRAPLRSMGGFARVMLEDLSGRLDADGERYLNIIHQEARNMGQLIDDLLALTRLGRRELTLGPIDMTELARRVWEDVRVGHKDRELEIEIQPLPGTLGDQAMIRQLLAHLLENAVKFTKGRRPAQIQVSGRSEGDEDVYCIKDDGVGFDMKYENKIYEVFQRMHPQEEFAGTGIGLAIVKRIVVRHGGRVWAESKAGEGAVFCFALPKKGSP
jgi:light-regulated signal transduction histidine kinase (bacteriophytochrome)